MMDDALKSLQLRIQQAIKHRSELVQQERDYVELENNMKALTLQIENEESILIKLLHDNEILEKKHDKLQEDITELEKKNIEIKSSLVMKPSDNLKMIKAKTMLNIGVQITGIRWDFSAPQNITRGYIANKEKGILKHFEFNQEQDDLPTILWKLIEDSSSADWSAFIQELESGLNKENVPKN